MRSGKKQNCVPRLGRKHIFENGKFDVYADCDNLKIREKRKKAPGCSGKHFFEGAMFELRFQRIFLKKVENRNCAPRLGRKHNFANFIIEPRSVGHNYFANGSSPLVRNENHENPLEGCTVVLSWVG